MFSHNELHALILTHCLQMCCECLQAVLFVQIKCNYSIMPESGYFLGSGATHYHFNSISSPTETCIIFIIRGLIINLCSTHTENAKDVVLYLSMTDSVHFFTFLSLKQRGLVRVRIKRQKVSNLHYKSAITLIMLSFTMIMNSNVIILMSNK